MSYRYFEIADAIEEPTYFIVENGINTMDLNPLALGGYGIEESAGSAIGNWKLVTINGNTHLSLTFGSGNTEHFEVREVTYDDLLPGAQIEINKLIAIGDILEDL